MSVVYTTTNTADGTEDGDIIVTGANGQTVTTVNAGGGDDFIVLEQGPAFIDTVATNNGFSTATSIDFAGNWTTAASPMFGDSTIPHTSIIGQGSGEFDYFAITLTAGQTITLDVDGGRGINEDGAGRVDTWLKLYDAVGGVVAANDDNSDLTLGGLGSTNGLDSYLTFTATTAGTYYIQVGQFATAGIAPIAAGGNYMLNVSATGHAATAPTPSIWDSTVYAGEGDDEIYGNFEYETVYGEGGNDIIYGLAGQDTLTGGAGNDKVYAGNDADRVIDGDGDDVLDGGLGTDTLSYAGATAGVTVSLAITTAQNTIGAGTDTITGFENLTGSMFDDTLTGDDTANTFYGGAGTNTMNGAGGADQFVYNGGSDIVDGGSENDTYYLSTSGVGWTVDLRAGTGASSVGGHTVSLTSIEVLYGSYYNDVITSKTGTTIYALDGDDYVYAILGVPETIDGGADIDTLDTTEFNSFNIGYSIDLVTGATSDGESYTNFENLISGDTADAVTGTAGANSIWTKGGDDSISAGMGDDIVEAGTGVNSIDGGDNVDWASYEHAASGVTVSLAIAGAQSTGISTDTLTNMEGLIGSAFEDTLTGDALANVFMAGGGDDDVIGGDGDDIMWWEEGGGGDNFVGGVGSDTLNLEKAASGWTVDLETGVAANGLGGAVSLSSVEQVYGSAFADTLVADNSGGSTLYGFDGDDHMYLGRSTPNTLYGGDGVDTLDTTQYDVANAYTIDLATGTTSDGETIEGFENLISAGTIDTVIGTDGANRIETRGGDDIIDGGAGIDTMIGGIGSDTYFVDHLLDNVVESNVAGFDIINSSVTYSLAGRAVERLVLTGAANANATGNAVVNDLVGNDGANTLDGKGGADTMAGGLGNDTYIVDDAGDVVTEALNAGTDLVQTGLSYTLGDNVERLRLVGTGNVNATGNGLENRLFGNDGNNRLDGLGGADIMAGGLGNDTYVVDHAGDSITEAASAGTDLVESSITWTLGNNLERLRLTGTANSSATGNSLDNRLFGNDGANTLNGLGGADEMQGGLGNDTYVVDSVGDVVTEAAGAGTDVVESSITYTLGANLERLRLTGTANINAIGNTLDNRLYGNDGNNVVNGGGGADQIYGRLGVDTLVGGAGADGFYFDTALGGGNIDKINDFNVADDTIFLENAIFAALPVTGVLAPGAFVTGAAAGDANDRIIYNAGTGALLYDADGNGAGAAVQFATLTVGLALTNADFTII